MVFFSLAKSNSATAAARVAEGVRRVIKPKFHARIELKAVQTEFASIVARGVKALVSSLLATLAAPLGTMQRQPWSTWATVGDTSEYVGVAAAAIGRVAALANRSLSPAHASFFAEQFVGEFVPRLLQTLYKTKRISEAGAQHLLLDMSVIKTT